MNNSGSMLERLKKLSVLVLPMLAVNLVQAQAINTYYWTGDSPLLPFFDNGENWLDVNGNPAAPLQSRPLALIFGAAGPYDHSYTPEVNGSEYRISRITVTAEAAQGYTITGGDALRILTSPGPGGSIITNASDYVLTIETPFDYLNTNTSNTPRDGAVSLTFDTGAGGIHWIGGSFRSANTGIITITKQGVGTLLYAGTHEYTQTVLINRGELLIDTVLGLSQTTGSVINLAGAQLRVVGDVNAGEAQSMTLGTLGFGSSGTSVPRRVNRVVIDPVSEGYGLTLSATWGGIAGQANNNSSNVIHFDLTRAGSAVHIQNKLTSWNSSAMVVSFATVTDTTGKTGFVFLDGNEVDGYYVKRYTGYTKLGTSVANNGSGWSNTTHYYVDGDHTLTGTGQYRGLVGVWENNHRVGYTLTMQGSGTLTLDNYHLRVFGLLLEEGTGDYTIQGLGLANKGGNWSANEMRIFQYRMDGRLIIDTEHIGVITNMPTTGTPTEQEGATNPANIPYNITTSSILTKAGPGTVVLKTNQSNFIGGVYIPEGRLQVEGDALSITTLVHVTDGVLGGSGRIGGGIKWVWDGAHVDGGVRYTAVTIAEGGVIDVTPSDDNGDELMRGLQITGSLTMENGSALAMNINRDVANGSYIPLLVSAEDSDEVAVTLAGDLRLSLDTALTSARLITLLATTGLIGGEFASINGSAFGPDNHFILSYLDKEYDFFLSYNYDLGAGWTGVVLQVIPEPSTIALLTGCALVALVYLRRGTRKTRV